MAQQNLLNTQSKEDFGGLVPDPNPVTAKDFINKVRSDKSINLGLACDADGDRNMLFSQKYNLEPSDSLAILLQYAHLVPFYQGRIYGVARSRSTSSAVDNVAKSLGINCYLTPTGWKYFGNLLDAEKITICGEESFGSGSNHSREKDGIWAILFWLHIISYTSLSMDEILEGLWLKHGRVYFTRHDLENLDENSSRSILSSLIKNAENNIGKDLINGYSIISVEDFTYTDITNNNTISNQGTIIKFNKNAELMIRISGTGTSGVIIRFYISRKEAEKDNLFFDKTAYLKGFVEAIYSLIKDQISPSIVV